MKTNIKRQNLIKFIKCHLSAWIYNPWLVNIVVTLYWLMNIIPPLTSAIVPASESLKTQSCSEGSTTRSKCLSCETFPPTVANEKWLRWHSLGLNKNAMGHSSSFPNESLKKSVSLGSFHEKEKTMMII